MSTDKKDEEKTQAAKPEIPKKEIPKKEIPKKETPKEEIKEEQKPLSTAVLTFKEFDDHIEVEVNKGDMQSLLLVGIMEQAKLDILSSGKREPSMHPLAALLMSMPSLGEDDNDSEEALKDEESK